MRQDYEGNWRLNKNMLSENDEGVFMPKIPKELKSDKS